MQIINLSYPFQPHTFDVEVTMALGYFDGVHLGHQAVIQEAIRLAHLSGTEPAVMTFHPHPREVLGKAKITRYLTPLSEKLASFSELGVKRAYVMKFDTEFAQLTKEEFVQQVLVPLQVKGVVTGFNYSFGRFASGKAEDLAILGKDLFTAKIVQPVEIEGKVLSSSRVRKELAEGEMEIVSQILGRPYKVKGKVVLGDQRGRKMKFPTANLQLDQPYMIPRRGVYVARVHYPTGVASGIMNIGVRPTFTENEQVEKLEVHLLDRDLDLYGQELEVEMLHFIRDEQKFSSMNALIEQIQKDRQTAEEWLAAYVE
ncbi:bifunctional riboflavin kinase/FAD synthetase [Hazenella coriacea]|uniref:Riboflavin biosynthesis protein n=1 Tax=Hazenella coriacea TaxID=1179467 RepID=A0A4R3L049_9BACL|nr:bifunctional riboflavin kinase/FAD synthetase [Hazenella coriacea]TCS92552.1 FMN adenylyltransferase /riboflavin kinase [Hazenella coriacea]